MRQVVGCRHRICFFQNELAAVFFPLLIFIASVTDELICKGIGGVIPAFVGKNRTPLFLPAYQVRGIQQITTGLFRHRRLWLLQEPARILPRCHSHRGLHRHRLHPRKCLANYFLPHRVLPNILLRFHNLRDQLQSPIRPHRYLAKRLWLLQVLRYILFGFIIVREDTDIRMICRTKVQEIVESSLGRARVKRAHGKVIAFAKNEASYLVLHFS